MSAGRSAGERVAQSAHDRVYRALRARIMQGEIPPGHALTLRGIAAEFGDDARAGGRGSARRAR